MVIIADIYVSTLDRKEVYQFPTLPEEFPTLSQSAKNEEFSTFNNGDFNLLNGSGLIIFSMGFMLPQQQYNFCKAPYTNSNKIISLMTRSMRNKMPIRFIFKGKDNAEVVNLAVTCEKLDWNHNKELDIVFSADFKQYRAIV